MAQFTEFVFNNLWVCIGFGVVILIVGDELLGVSRNMLGDGTEDAPMTPQNRQKAAEEEVIDPLDAMGEYDVRGQSIDDFIRKR